MGDDQGVACSAGVGPLIWAGTSDVTVRVLGLPPHVGQGIGVLVLLTPVFVSDLVFSPVTDTPRNWNESSGVMAAARSSFSTTN